MKYYVIIKDGLFDFEHKDGKPFFDFLKKNNGKICEFEFRVLKNNKSNQQNRYFRGVIVKHFKLALREAGYQSFTDDEYFQILKTRFFSYKKGSETFFHSTCNSDWESGDWEDKMIEIRNWVYEKLNYIIPLPNESLNLKSEI